MNEARRLGTCTDTLTRRKKVYLLPLSSYTATPSYWDEGLLMYAALNPHEFGSLVAGITVLNTWTTCIPS